MTEKQIKQLTLPMIFLVALNVAPSVYMRPMWSVIFAAVLLGYRAYLHLSHAKMPQRVVMFIGQMTVAIAIWQHYMSFFGDEAAGTFLTLLTCLKTYELKTKRDFFLTALLCFLVLMSALLLDQSLFLTIFLFTDLVLLMTFLFALEQDGWEWKGWKSSLKPALMLTLKALPLMVAIFVLFPRFSTGFGTGPNTAAKTGVTDSLKPGSVSNLIASDELVFRATFLDGNMPPRQDLYWRGAVLDRAEDLNWSRSAPIDRRRATPMDEQGQIEIYLESGFEKFLFSLEDTASLTFPKGTRVSMRNGHTFELDQTLQTRQRYYLHRGSHELGENEKEEPSDYLNVSAPSAKMKELVAKLKQPTAAGSVRAIQTRFRDGGFTYSMQPRPIDSLDDFLFQTRQGFCEHYAGAAATLLRHMGIPARVVVGFQGGTPSFLENYITVRAHDAHAWIEYYDKDAKVWRRNDPTASVDPSRITEGSQAYLKEESSWLPGPLYALFDRGRRVFDEIDASWSGFLLRFDLARQQEMLAKLGMEGVLFRALPVFLILAIVLILSVLYYFEAQAREQVSEEERLYRTFLRRLKRKWRIEKRANEGPLDFLHRIEHDHPAIGEHVRPVMAELIHIRFSAHKMDGKERDALRSQIRRLGRVAAK